MPTALALSPHLDDAAFSCGGTLALLARGGWRMVMATLFTGSVPDPHGFALACQLDKGLGPDVDYMRLRRAEDATAAEALGVAWEHLPFREAPHRGYASAPELFGETRADDHVAADLAPALADLVAHHQADLILAPQAVGGHVDHVQAIRALDAVASGLPVLWWRDFPYTVRAPDPREPLRARFADLPRRIVGLDDEAEARKRAACAAYATQIGFQFGGAAGLDRRLAEEGGREVFSASGPLPAGVPGTDAPRPDAA